MLNKECEMLAFNEDLKKKLHEYINVFRTKIGTHLRPEFGQEIRVVGFPDGVILNVLQKPYIWNEDKFMGFAPSLTDAFTAVNKRIEDYLEGEELTSYLSAVKEGKMPFDGPNILFGDGLLIIKSKEEWTIENAQKDVSDIINYIEAKAAAKKANDVKVQIPPKG